jgi:hypothetical protein
VAPCLLAGQPRAAEWRALICLSHETIPFQLAGGRDAIALRAMIAPTRLPVCGNVLRTVPAAPNPGGDAIRSHADGVPGSGSGGRLPGIDGNRLFSSGSGSLGAGSRSAVPLRFSVIFEDGGLIP